MSPVQHERAVFRFFANFLSINYRSIFNDAYAFRNTIHWRNTTLRIVAKSFKLFSRPFSARFSEVWRKPFRPSNALRLITLLWKHSIPLDRYQWRDRDLFKGITERGINPKTIYVFVEKKKRHVTIPPPQSILEPTSLPSFPTEIKLACREFCARKACRSTQSITRLKKRIYTHAHTHNRLSLSHTLLIIIRLLFNCIDKRWYYLINSRRDKKKKKYYKCISRSCNVQCTQIVLHP